MGIGLKRAWLPVCGLGSYLKPSYLTKSIYTELYTYFFIYIIFHCPMAVEQARAGLQENSKLLLYKLIISQACLYSITMTNSLSLYLMLISGSFLFNVPMKESEFKSQVCYFDQVLIWQESETESFPSLWWIYQHMFFHLEWQWEYQHIILRVMYNLRVTSRHPNTQPRCKCNNNKVYFHHLGILVFLTLYLFRCYYL